MEAKQMTFYTGRATQTNTYNSIIRNAFELIKATANPEKFKGSEFDDFLTLLNDKTQDKTELANYVNEDITEAYQGDKGAYMKEELKRVESSYSYDWIANINNKAIEAARALSDTSFSIIK